MLVASQIKSVLYNISIDYMVGCFALLVLPVITSGSEAIQNMVFSELNPGCGLGQSWTRVSVSVDRDSACLLHVRTALMTSKQERGPPTPPESMLGTTRHRSAPQDFEFHGQRHLYIHNACWTV